MWRQLCIGATLVLLALMAISGRSRFDGPVLLPVTANHGLHAADFVVLLVAAAGLVALASLGRTTRGR
jgi:hypothetical protein